MSHLTYGVNSFNIILVLLYQPYLALNFGSIQKKTLFDFLRIQIAWI